MSTPSPSDASDDRDNEVLATPTSPQAVRSDEGPGISDTDDAEARGSAGAAGRDAYEKVRNTPDSRT